MNYAPRHRRSVRNFLQSILTLFAVLAGILGLSLTAIAPASTEPADQKIVTVRLSDRPDSGEDGNTWALDNLRRQAVVTQTSPGVYSVVVEDIGTFVTIDGEKTPGDDDGADVFDGSVVGTVKGGFTATVEAPAEWATFNRSGLSGAPSMGADMSSAALLEAMFDDGSAEVTAIFTDWGWDYRYQNQAWHNAKGGNEGNITGRS
jgi:hypothetical protein